ncbi:hypothetical protein, partial [Succinivibrio dextrinosolvens]
MKRKIRHLDAIKHGSSLYSLNTLSVNPLTIAVYSVLAGMSLTASADTTTQSPSTIDATLPLPNGNNRVTSFTTSPATITVTSSGVVNYPDADTNLSCSKLFVDGSNDGNSITSYGTINGSTNNQYQSNLMGAYTNLNAAVQGNVQGNNNTVTFKAGSSTKNLTVYGAQIIDDYSGNAVTASGNTVFIENGSEFLGNKMITGGYAGGNGSSTASNNKVILGSGTYSSTIYGGWAYGQTQVNISNNTVYLYGDANVSAAGIYGGETNWYINAVTLTGNTLVFGYNNTPWTPSSYTIGNVKNFSTIRFDNVVWGKTITINFFANKSTDSTVTKIDATKVAFSGVDSLSSGDSYDMLTI